MTQPRPIPQIGSFESTYQPHLDVDVAETTRHDVRWRSDLALLGNAGVRTCRYPIRWHRIEPEPGRYLWEETDAVLAHLHELRIRPIADLLHHTSYPRWLSGFDDPRFADAYLAYVETFAERYPWIPAYTLFNEPFTTFLLCGVEGIWPPHLTSLDGFIRLARSVMPALAAASRRLRLLIPDARHVHVEVCERASWTTPAGQEYAAYTNDRRFFLTDLLIGRPVDRERPFARTVEAAGGSDLLEIEPGHIDVLGLDYYAHNQWEWNDIGDGTPVPTAPAAFADLIEEYAARYERPLIIGETNIRGAGSDRATWLKYTLEQAEQAASRGIEVEGYCWFPFIDSCDWASLLCRSDREIDPVGVYALDKNLDRYPTTMTSSWIAAAQGAPASQLPAYELATPAARWLAGWLPQLTHWDWQPTPASTLSSEDYDIELRVRP